MPKRNLFLIAAIIAAAACVVVFNHIHPTQVDSKRPDNAQGQPADAAQEQLAQALRIIRQNYLYPVKDDMLVRDSIGGMVKGLDEFSRYVPPEKLAEFNSRMNGSYRGVGLKLEIISGQVVVIGPMLGSSADRAGFHTGDKIISIDKHEVGLLPLPRIYELLDGGAGGSVNIVFQRGADRRERDLPRNEMELETVVGLFRTGQGKWVYTLDAKEGIAYVRLREFCPKTAEQLEQVLRDLSNLRSIVLDLRGNPGGGLPVAVSAANLFLREGMIVKSVDRAGHQELYRARPEKTFSEAIPLAILVNGQTASAAEIMAGSLWVYSRAVLIGTRTRGKGCVQSLFPLAQGLISLTTSEYLLRGDFRISNRGGIGGIAPDLRVATEREDELDGLRLRGEVLFQPTPETMPATWPDGGADLTPSFLSLDEPLAAAMKLLRDRRVYKALIKKSAQARTTMPTTVPTTSRGDDE